MTMTARYQGVFPVVPTTFNGAGELDVPSQLRCIDFMIDAGSTGLCILANFSEQFLLSDAEREVLTAAILKHVAGRVPVIVTTTHFGTRVCAERCRRAESMGAAMVMVMPPYHGATLRASEENIYEFYAALSSAIDIPIMIHECAHERHAAVAGFFGAHGERNQAGVVFQDRDGRSGVQVARADPSGWRCD